MNKSKDPVARNFDIAALVVFLIGGFYWYSTPDDVIIGPLLVIAVALALAGAAWYRKKQGDQKDTDELAEKYRQQNSEEHQ